MPFSEIALVLRWILPLWALGWLVLPLSSRGFPFLPDKGLAAGRFVALFGVGLIAFWGAATHLLPLRFAQFLLIASSFFVGIGWKKAAFRAGIPKNWRAFLVSDAVFLLAFAAFLWVRLRHPDAGDLEKPMDMALISAAMRADFLPFENPWFAGQNFTNYYYFGPFLSAITARTFATPPHFAYNLLQPMWAALFLSATWSLCAALAKSSKTGVAAMLLVGIGGPLEPLRQWSQNGQPWPLDWWKTSRVIPNTINEYPAFTLLSGDMHAHFFAFCGAITHFALCFGLIKTDSPRLRSALLLLGGVFLGFFVLTNTWDAPFYGILWLGCAIWARKNRNWTPQNSRALATSFVLAPLVALPYLLRFRSQVSGIALDPWLPDLFSLALFWGSWWMLGFFALAFDKGEDAPSHEAIFRRFLFGVGGAALLFPFLFYIRGAFGDGDLRHQDTVFKFGLQAWLLLGIGTACEAGSRLKIWAQNARIPQKIMVSVALAAFVFAVSLAPVAVAWTRTVRDAPRDAPGNPIYSLDAARFLPPGELQAAEWLRQNVRAGESFIEPILLEDGQIRGDYNAKYGSIAAFSGAPSVVGWPQHIAGWGAPWDEINRRAALVSAVYSEANPLPAIEKLGATYVYWRATPSQRIWTRSSRLKMVWHSTTGDSATGDSATGGSEAQIWRFIR